MTSPMRGSGVGYVIFDLDGTLVDTFGLIVASFNYALRAALGERPIKQRFPDIYGPPSKIFSKSLSSEQVAAAVLSYHEYYEGAFSRVCSSLCRHI